MLSVPIRYTPGRMEIREVGILAKSERERGEGILARTRRSNVSLLEREISESGAVEERDITASASTLCGRGCGVSKEVKIYTDDA